MSTGPSLNVFAKNSARSACIAIVYDGDGNRVGETVGSTTTKYLVDTLNPTGYAQVMDELVSGAMPRTHTYGLQLISENQKIGATQTASFYGYDGHGNVRFLTGTTGTVTDTYVYDAFGLPITTTGTTPNNYLYSGEQFDSVLGMYYLRTRYYNPATGRFLSMDPEEGDVGDPTTLQKYAYTANDPVNGTDPTCATTYNTGADLVEGLAYATAAVSGIEGAAILEELGGDFLAQRAYTKALNAWKAIADRGQAQLINQLFKTGVIPSGLTTGTMAAYLKLAQTYVNAGYGGVEGMAVQWQRIQLLESVLLK